MNRQWVTFYNLEVVFNLGPVDQPRVEVAGKPIRVAATGAPPPAGRRERREREKRALHTRATRPTPIF